MTKRTIRENAAEATGACRAIKTTHGRPWPDSRRRAVRAGYGVARERFIPFSRAFPTTERPYGITERAVIDKIVERDAGKPLEIDAPIPKV